MDFFVILLSLGLLIFVAYRGYSVILFAPLCALLAVLLTAPEYVLPFFSNVFMEKMVSFIKSYFAVFLLGAIFGKVVEMSGIAESIAKTIVQLIGAKRAMLAIVLLGAILTYSGVSLFVAVFAIYPFAAQMFREADIPKRLIPGTIALGTLTFTMDALPGTPQIQNVIPTTFFKTDIYAAPVLGLLGGAFVLICGLLYLEYRRKKAEKSGEGYYGFPSETAAALEAEQEPAPDLSASQSLARQIFAFVPLVLVGVMNKVFTTYIPKWYPDGFNFSKIGLDAFGTVDINAVAAIWAVEMALVIGILATVAFDWKRVTKNLKEGLNASIGGSLLATMNTGAEYGIRVWRRYCLASRFYNDQPRHFPYVYKPARKRRGNNHHACRGDRLGIGRHGDCTERDGGSVQQSHRRCPHSARSYAPCCCHGIRRDGYPSA